MFSRGGSAKMEKSSSKVPNDLIGIAGVHYVVSELSRRGLIALPTIRNTAGIDIIVSKPDATAQAFLQVKTSLKKVKFWPVSRPEKCLKGPRSFYVFLRFLQEEDRFEVFIESDNEVIKQVRENLENYKKRGRKEFAYWILPSSDSDIRKLHERWESWQPPLI